jgi:hypothetical protein
MEADPDRALVERCRNDDATALKELIERYQDDVFSPIASVTQAPARAEQLAQDVFFRVHRNLPYFRGEASVRDWVLRTAAEVCPAAFDGSRPSGSRPAPPTGSTPSQFAARTLAAIRRDRWQREQMLDVAFNISVAAVALVTVALVWYVVRASGLSGLLQNSVGLAGTQAAGMARNVAPSVPGYAAAVVVIGGVLLAWWWAER